MATLQECNVAGEIRSVPLNDLVQNTAVQYLLANPKSKPRWCLRKTPHDINTCTFLHRTPDKASNYVMVRGEPAPVSIGHLIQNKGLEMIIGSLESFGEWCDLASPHDIVMCKRLHLGNVKDDKTVFVEGEEAPVSVSHLLLNRGVSYLLSFPEAKGVWCNNKIVHDVINCPYIHRRIDGHPKVVNVEDEKFPVPVHQLVSNAALNFLLDNPQCSGRWCGRVVNHDVEQCSYLHRRHPFVRVDGESIRINTIKSNRGLKYLLEHPEAQGHWCRSTHDEQHPMETCTFIHPKEGREYQAEAALSRGPATHGVVYGDGANPPNGRSGNGVPRQQSDTHQQPHQPQHQQNNFTLAAPPGAFGRNPPLVMHQGGIGSARGRGGNVNIARGGMYPPQSFPQGVFNIPEGFNGAVHNNNQNVGNFGSQNAYQVSQEEYHQVLQSPPMRPAGNVVVDGQAYDASTMVNNAGLQFLLKTPMAAGRFCTRVNDPNHRQEICRYIHKLQ